MRGGQKANNSPYRLCRVRVQHPGCLLPSLLYSVPMPVRAISTMTRFLTSIKAEGWVPRLFAFSIQGIQFRSQCPRQHSFPRTPILEEPVFSMTQACTGYLRWAKACSWEHSKHCSCRLYTPELVHTGPMAGHCSHGELGQVPHHHCTALTSLHPDGALQILNQSPFLFFKKKPNS